MKGIEITATTPPGRDVVSYKTRRRLLLPSGGLDYPFFPLYGRLSRWYRTSPRRGRFLNAALTGSTVGEVVRKSGRQVTWGSSGQRLGGAAKL
jgi:hypothetical protein